MASFVHIYVRLLLAVEILLFTASVVLHMTVLAGAQTPFTEYGHMLFSGTLIAGFAAIPFAKAGLRWMVQIRTCRVWMWKSALGMGLYSIGISCVAMLFYRGSAEPVVALSGAPIGFDAVCICVLCSATLVNYLDYPELVRATRISLAMLALVGMVIAANRAGYVHRAN